jgi:hypothetical protein
MPEAAIFRARSFIISHRAPLPVLLPTVRERSEPAPPSLVQYQLVLQL